MLYFLQLLARLNKRDQKHFVALFNDLSFEIEELGYRGSEVELIDEMLLNHFGIELESESQLKNLTIFILSHQGELSNKYYTFNYMGVLK